MSSYGHNNNSQNQPLFSNRKHITCRLCDRVLFSAQALITHIESHIVQGDIRPPTSPNHLYNQPPIQPYHNQNQNHDNNINFSIQNPNHNNLCAASALPLFPSGGPAVQVQRPIPTRLGPGLNLTLGGGSYSVARSVKPSRAPCVVSPENEANKRGGSSGRAAKREKTSVEDVVNPIDGTRPFLSQLDRPIPKVVDLEIGNEEDLDLTLKL